eukprot:42069_1
MGNKWSNKLSNKPKPIRQTNNSNDSILKRIDDALGKYYKQCGRNDYYDGNGNGKFITFIHINKCNENQIEALLCDDTNSDNNLFIKIDPQFPLIDESKITDRKSRNDEIFKIVKHCYKFGAPPKQNPYTKNEIDRLLPLSSTSQNKFILKWYHIENAIKQELYDKISSKFMQMVNGKKRYDDIDELLNELEKKMNIDQNELNYLKQLIERAKIFNLNITNDDEKVLWDQHTEVDMALITDIFSVHNCFLFSNFHFQQLDISDLKGLSVNEDLIKQNPNSISLYPQYVIDDDMYLIWKYFFAASHLVNKLIITKSKNTFSLKITIIPNNVVSIYDPDIKFPFYDPAGYRAQRWNDQFRSNLSIFNSYKSCSISLETLDLFTILELFEDRINERFGKNTHVQIIIDRRTVNENKQDTVHILVLNKEDNDNFMTLDKNYFISLFFTVKERINIVQCYLFYGLNEYERMRFYPEYLTSIIPRFFKRNHPSNYSDNIQKLYDDSYKHGFAVDLYDPIFNKHYKQMTKYEHISVNYNRLIMEEKEEGKQETQYEYKDIKYHKLNKMNKKCNFNTKLEVEQCPFIDYIIYSLNLFQDMDNGNIDVN